MANMIQAIRGMHDILPGQTGAWQAIESILREVLQGYGYEEIRMPLLEKTELYLRTIGEVTDIVEKEMYTFNDRNGDSLSLRPEGTAGCVRAGIENGLLHHQTPRLWYMGPMFRHERPQKGRFRQFHQMGVEVFGLDGPDIDAELILIANRIFQRFGLRDLELQINSLGTVAARQAYREKLVKYFSAHQAVLDEDSQRRLYTNPLRILDSKNPELAEVIREAPRLIDDLDDESQRHFERLQTMLSEAGIKYVINERLVRGLDYYTKTVFEWVSRQLGAQGTVCAGGRFDGLVEQLGGKPTPAMGFALGMERLYALLEDAGALPVTAGLDVYLVTVGEAAEREGRLLAERLRDANAALRVLVNSGGGSFKSQFKRADKSGAQVALILGDDELTAKQVAIKALRVEVAQQTWTWDQLIKVIQRAGGNVAEHLINACAERG